MKMFIILLAFTTCAFATINKYWHVDPSGTGNTTQGGTWANAINYDSLDHVLENDVVAGDVFFIRGGTYTAASSTDASARDGTSVSPIAIIGVKAATTNEGASIVKSDWAADSADKPHINLGASYTFKVGTFSNLRNLYFYGQTNNLVYVEARSKVVNCKFNLNYGSGAARYGLYAGLTGCKVIRCEFISANCSGLNAGTGCVVLNCFFHDMTNATGGVAITLGGDNMAIVNNIFYNNRLGLSSTTRENINLIGNTIKKGATAISATNDTTWLVANTIVDSMTTSGFSWGSQRDCNEFIANHGDDAHNTDMWVNVDVSTIFQDYRVTTGDPMFTTPGTNFSLQAGSPCLNTGYGVDTLWAK